MSDFKVICALNADREQAAELSDHDHRELARFGAYLTAAKVYGQTAAYELVYGDSTPKARGEA